MPFKNTLQDQNTSASIKLRAGRNRTLTANGSERLGFSQNLLPSSDVNSSNYLNKTIIGDCFDAISRIPKSSIDLIILDPPYNLNKKFGAKSFSRTSVDNYTEYLRKLFSCIKNILKDTATVYVCGDWFSSTSIFTAATEFFVVRNRITWEREKGRGALTNWKNSSEDIWFCTMSDKYTFNVDSVKLRRRVIAPYRHDDGRPKDWLETANGNFRDTHPSNLWNDITIPFWSMPENTDHPTQKSEKLIAKLMLASSNSDDVVLDPFLGSGTSSVVAKKLGRNYCGIEIEEEFAILAEKRLAIAKLDKNIQGYRDNVFWDRNSLNQQNGASVVGLMMISAKEVSGTPANPRAAAKLSTRRALHPQTERILIALLTQSQSISATDLAKLTDIEETRVRNFLVSLERRGLATVSGRIPNPAGGKAIQLWSGVTHI